jgi:hypothetical protein
MAEATLRSYENGNRVISAETAIDIETRIGIPRAALRSDLWDAKNPPARRAIHPERAPT